MGSIWDYIKRPGIKEIEDNEDVFKEIERILKEIERDGKGIK
jgi:hypothetical protein